MIRQATVTASITARARGAHWEAPAERKRVRPALAGRRRHVIDAGRWRQVSLTLAHVAQRLEHTKAIIEKRGIRSIVAADLDDGRFRRSSAAVATRRADHRSN